MGKNLLTIEKELKGFSLGLLTEFKRVVPLVERHLSEEELYTWAGKGTALAQGSFRSWEAATEYFRATPRVLESLGFPGLIAWARCGGKLSGLSTALSSAYFRASVEVAPFLTPSEIPSWAQMGESLYSESWKSSSLSCRFFETSPKLLPHLGLEDLGEFALFLDSVAKRSYELAAECVAFAEEVLPRLEKQDRRGFLSLTLSLMETTPSDGIACFKAGATVLSRIQRQERSQFISLAKRMVGVKGRYALPFLLECSQALARLDQATHRSLLQLAEELLSRSCPATMAFLKNCSSLLDKLRLPGLEHWFREGLKILEGNEEGGLAYFRLESSKSEALVERLSSGEELGWVREILQMYCRALTGKTPHIVSSEDSLEKGTGWPSGSHLLQNDGATILLPPSIDKYASRKDNFSWYKVASAHQAGHFEFGSFAFAFEKASTLFSDLRPQLPPAKGNGAASDLERFFNLFGDRRLALDIFTVVEDSRVDQRVKHQYRGLRGKYERIQRDTLGQRPSAFSLPLREAFLELLIRQSLGELTETLFPQALVPRLEEALRILEKVQSPEADVEDSAEATIRLYAILSQIPNKDLPPEEEENAEPEMDDNRSLDLANLSLEPVQLDSGETPYTSPEEVDFRGNFKRELLQLLLKLKLIQQGQDAEEGASLSPEDLEELLKESLDAIPGDLNSSDLFVSELSQEAGDKANSSHYDSRERKEGADLTKGDPLEARESLTFLYDEWDFRASDYKPRWCRIRQKVLEEGGGEFFEKTLREHSNLANQVRRQFEMLSREHLRKMKRLSDGDDFELDAVIEAMVDRRVGNSPSEKIYWRRNKVERDIAVAFLLDMSASTSEAVEQMKRSFDDYDYRYDSRHYFSWRRTLQGEEEPRKTYKRIIDVEKESIVLLITALESIGDTYGIYGFSGYGRDSVEFYVIKDLEEAFSERAKRRIDKISPMQATRMGPAIRHTTTKLEGQGAKTKILFLLSDGRPQDQGYSRDGVEKEYAIHDTKKALLEAKRKKIVPFCLTVDKAGHDYLKTMCGDMGYEVVGEIESLPKRLPGLYRRLTL